MSPLDDTATAYVDANGLRFAYQIHSREDDNGADETIVLIRGLGTQMIEWSPTLIDTLTAGGLRVVIFDNRDVGLSGKAQQDYALSDMADDVVQLMAALGVQRFHIFGISLGGMVAQLVAANYGQAVISLCSVMSTSGNRTLPLATPEVRARMRVSANDRAGRIELETENRAIFGSPEYPESEDVRRAMSIRVYDRCDYPEGVSRQMLAAMDDGSRVERLGRIRVPALVIHGADDPLILPPCGEDTARNIDGAEFQLIDGMGHNIPDSLAADIGARVLSFLAKRAARTGAAR